MGRRPGSKDLTPRKPRVNKVKPVPPAAATWKKGFKPPGAIPAPGKPKGAISIRRLITELLEMSPEEASQRKPVSIGQSIVMAQVQSAIKGDTRAFEVLAERVEPKTLINHLTMQNPDGSAIFAPRFDTVEGKAKMLSSLTDGG